jgi:hypothetical protein
MGGCFDYHGGKGRNQLLYNNTPSKAIENVASNITYRPLIEAAVL